MEDLQYYGISTPIAILVIIEYWILFEKAGESGWKYLIPFYAEYTAFKIARREKLFWWWLGTGLASAVVFVFFFVICMAMASSTATELILMLLLSGVLSFALGIAQIVIAAKFSIAFAKAFGQSTAFGVGMLFLKPIFAGILAFSKDISYVGNSSTENFQPPMNQYY